MVVLVRVGIIGLSTELTPPTGYGAVGRVVAALMSALADRAEIVPILAQGSPMAKQWVVPYEGRRGEANPELMREHLSILSSCDIVHANDEQSASWLRHNLAGKVPVIETLHTYRKRLDPDSFYAFITAFQASQYDNRNFIGWSRPVIQRKLLARRSETQDLLMIGQVRPEKGVADAAKIAMLTNRRLILAGPLAKRNEAWFAREITKVYGRDRVIRVGEVNDHQRTTLLQTSSALLFLSDPPEPCGLVMLEAMAGGTPVLALARGACQELVRDGVGGFVKPDLVQLSTLARQVAELDPKGIQRRVASFTPHIIAEEHLAAYHLAIHRSGSSHRANHRQEGLDIQRPMHLD